MSVITRGFGDKQSIILRGFNLPLISVQASVTGAGLRVRLEVPRREKTLIDVTIAIPLQGVRLQQISKTIAMLGTLMQSVVGIIEVVSLLLQKVEHVGCIVGDGVKAVVSRLRIYGDPERENNEQRNSVKTN